MPRVYNDTDRKMMRAMGCRLKTQRKECGLTQAELARLMTVELAAVQRWESGRRGLSAVQLEQLSRALDISADYLLGLVK